MFSIIYYLKKQKWQEYEWMNSDDEEALLNVNLEPGKYILISHLSRSIKDELKYSIRFFTNKESNVVS